MGNKIQNSMCDIVKSAFGVTDAEDAYLVAPLTLAYIGDTVYDLYVRSYFVSKTKHTVTKLHPLAVKMVCASAQAKAFRLIEHMLTDTERAVFKRGKNTHSTVPKNANTADYRIATGFEALLGYLYLSGNDEKLTEIMQTIFDHS